MKSFIPRTNRGLLCLYLFILSFSNSIIACVEDPNLVSQTLSTQQPEDIGWASSTAVDDDDLLQVFEIHLSFMVKNKNVKQIYLEIAKGKLEQVLFEVSGRGTFELTTSVALPGTQVVLSTSSIMKNGNVCSSSALTLDGTQGEALPVELIEFNGREQGQGNLLSWTTDYEDNTSHFELESSLDGKSWRTAEEVPAIGFSSQTNTYSVLDKQIAPLIYYRLRIVDFDGEIQFSDIIVLERVDARISQPLRAFPVPSLTQAVTVQYRSAVKAIVTIQLVNQMGGLIRQSIHPVSKGDNSFAIDLSNEPTGTYYLTVFTEDQWHTTRLIKG